MTGHRDEPAYILAALGLLSWGVCIFFLVTGVAAAGRRSTIVVHLADDPIRFVVASFFPFLLGCLLIYLGLRRPKG